MEHRYYKRLPAAVNVELSLKGQQLGSFKTCDVGMNGIGINHAKTDLAINDVLDISVTLNKEASQRFETKGLVIHHSKESTGFIFMNHQPELIHRVQKLLQATV